MKKPINTDPNTINAEVLDVEIKWFRKLLEMRLSNADGESGIEEFESNNFIGPKESYYAKFLHDRNLNFCERVLLLSALLAEIKPTVFILKDEHNQPLNFLQFVAQLRGINGNSYTNHPDLFTVLFILAGNNTRQFLKYRKYFIDESKLVKDQIIQLANSMNTNERDGTEKIELAGEYLNYLLHGTSPRPDFGKNFPATIITTGLEWSDLVVPETTINELQRITKWQSHGSSLIQETAGKLNGSFTCLFYGASGSGKTLAVQLLGKSLGVDVFRIDLSMVVSKYIGETEKNLSFLFDRAKNKDWILFFDEADALFGKRTDIKESKDKWANLEMSYLLQRMEDHNGLTVLATNFRNNLDLALSRRFQSVIYFAKPDKEQRKALWKKLMPLPYTYDSNINFDDLAHFELTGGNITNVIKAACLDAKYAGNHVVSEANLYEGIKREFAKENRILTQ